MPASEATLHDGKHFVHMDGKEVFRFATRVMGRAAREALEIANMTTDDIQWIIPHQANYRIIETAAKYLKMPMEKFLINVDRYGNTSTASIPIVTVEAAEKGQLKPGDKVVFVGFGAGLTWGALTAEWTGPLPDGRTVHPEQYRRLARVRSFWRRLVRLVEGLFFPREL
jgi:3-oxoacyl-[acyl-carrier-protein] synthase-3